MSIYYVAVIDFFNTIKPYIFHMEIYHEQLIELDTTVRSKG
jgi:hypothetical protein